MTGQTPESSAPLWWDGQWWRPYGTRGYYASFTGTAFRHVNEMPGAVAAVVPDADAVEQAPKKVLSTRPGLADLSGIPEDDFTS